MDPTFRPLLFPRYSFLEGKDFNTAQNQIRNEPVFEPIEGELMMNREHESLEIDPSQAIVGANSGEVGVNKVG